MLGGTRRWLAVLVTLVAVATLPGVAHANGDSKVLGVLVLGDSYSAGNGGGSYYGTPTCHRSGATYASQLERLVEARPGGPDTVVRNVACSGAVTADLLRARGRRPAQVEAVDVNQDVVLLTIGGNDVGFSTIVTSCLLALTRRAAACDAALTHAERMLSDGTLQGRLTNVLTAIRARTGPGARIVLVGYPYLERDASFTLSPSSSAGGAPVAAGQRVRALTDAGDRIGEQVTAALNARQGTTANIAVSSKAAFAGHELSATGLTAGRYFNAPLADADPAGIDAWYHPNRAGYAAEAKLLLDDPRVPKADAG
jgi:lysophospholipase L1-like esterase